MLFVVGEGITTVNLGIFDDVGNSRAIFLGQVLNVVLTFLFVGTFEMGISSAGLALIVSTLTNSAYMIFNYLRLPERSLKFVNVFKSGAKKFFSQSVEVIKSGIPAACSVSLISIKVFAIYQLLGVTGGAESMTLFANLHGVSFRRVNVHCRLQRRNDAGRRNALRRKRF